MSREMPSASCRFRAGLCMEINALPSGAVIFGAEGDLARRKLFPALFRLHQRGLIHEKTRIAACARKAYPSLDAYRENLRTLLLEKSPACSPDSITNFLARIDYVSGDFGDDATYRKLSGVIASYPEDNRVIYLATAPEVYPVITDGLFRARLTIRSRIVFEKPFGNDYESALRMDRELCRHLEEEQIYRIDHYIGKETVQNILMFRFANILFEPVWNRNYIECVHISALEELGVEHRAKYFDHAGILRDMFQNHILQMLSLAAMEMPSEFRADALHDEKIKLLHCVRRIKEPDVGKFFLRGQYIAGSSASGMPLPGYREEPGVALDSTTETFAAAKLFIDNWRWADVPFYLRSGKRTGVKRSEIVVTFKHIPHSIFHPLKSNDLPPDRLTFAVQPDEGLTLSIAAKHPGPKLCLGALDMNFCYSSILPEGEGMPDAYERLLLDAMLGDRTLFIRSDAVEFSWKLLTPVLNVWGAGITPDAPLYFYEAGTRGPKEANELLFPVGTSAQDLY